MATPKPGPRPEPPPPIPTLETDVSPLKPGAEVPVPTIHADISPLQTDASKSIGIFTPDALLPRIPAPTVLPRSNQGVSRPTSAPLSPPAATGLPAVGTDPPRTPSVTPVLSSFAPWSATSIPSIGMAKPGTQAPAVSVKTSASNNGVAARPPSIAAAGPAAPAAELGMVGPYRLCELIGEGGMGLVYRAEDTFLKRPVALKVMRPDVAKDERSWKRFLIEAQATAALRNDRIATIYQIGEDKGRFFLAMELLSGEPLEARLRRGPMTMRQVLWVAREAAMGLAVAHEAGFIHRDIKPGNLWLETKPGAGLPADPLHRFRGGPADRLPEPTYLRVKILDFGLVRLGQDEISRKKAIVGTPAYMSPEQAAGHGSDARSDIFSLGVVMFRMLTGKLPFEGETTMELLTALTTQTAPPVSKYNAAVPPALTNLIGRMLSRDPAARPGMAAHLVREIEAIERALTAPKPARRSRRQELFVVGAMVLALIVFGGSWAVFQANQSSADGGLPVVAAPAKALLTPEEAAQVIGDHVRVEFVVGVVNRAGDVAYLYESAPKGDDVTFRVALPQHLIAAMRKRGSFWPDTLQGARLRLQGQVSREGRFAEILVGDLSQFETIVYNDRAMTNPPQ
jgi:serine/threonine protein kinase